MFQVIAGIQPGLATAERSAAAMVFEAAVMYRYVTAARAGIRRDRRSGRHKRGAGVVADFDSQVAAERFGSALAAPGREVAVVPVTGGIRHRHLIHRVTVDPAALSPVLDDLTAVWRAGVRRLVDPAPLGPTEPRWLRRQEYAVSAWRGVLLAGRPVRNPSALLIRTPDLELSMVLVRAGRLLGAPAVTDRDGGGQFVRLEAGDTVARLLRAIVERLPAGWEQRTRRHAIGQG
ncbi:hypothetical protein [Dactylosporangium sp. CA-233914]|uniref:hypothetical protein n=1 Tax=Dactylosporangium sp. CA-233914 TaxID=3239934 RepID=UPI003D9508C5